MEHTNNMILSNGYNPSRVSHPVMFTYARFWILLEKNKQDGLIVI